MSEESENKETPKPEELQSLFGSFDFTPDWAKGTPGVTQSEPEQRSRGGGGRGRDNREGGGRPRVPKSSRPNMQGVRVKPRRGESDNRGPAQDRPRGPRDDNFRGHPPREERAPRVPVHVDFIPEKKRLSKVVKVIRNSHRAFPLRVVAEKFMENPSFISMKYTVRDLPEGQEEFNLYVCTANGMVFSDAQACEQYVMDHGMEMNYEREDREVPPPSGNFVCVGRHSRSGRLIGPPNWHGYQARLEELRSEIAEGVPMEAFSRGIEMVHDADMIEAWKKEVSVQSFYHKKVAKVEAEEGGQRPEVGGQADPTDQADPADQPDQPDQADPTDQPDPADQPDPTDQPDQPDPTDQPDQPDPVEQPYEWTREQAEADFRKNYLPKLIRKTKRTIMPGYLFDKMTDPGLLSLTRFHLKREHERPNSIVFALRPAFKHMRLHVFRHHGELMVSGIAQHPLPDDLKVVAEIRSILDYVAANPGCNTQEALKAVANNTEEVPAEWVSHFRWLIEKGHLVEFHDDTLQLPHAPRPK
jgi:hypothetical protein